MRGRLRSVSGHVRHALTSGWQIARAPAGSTIDAAQAVRDLSWVSIERRTTVAAALLARKEWSFEGATRRFDAEDWWYRTRFDVPPAPAGTRAVLGFDGLATLASAWLNGKPCFRSENMF